MDDLQGGNALAEASVEADSAPQGSAKVKASGKQSLSEKTRQLGLENADLRFEVRRLRAARDEMQEEILALSRELETIHVARETTLEVTARLDRTTAEFDELRSRHERQAAEFHELRSQYERQAAAMEELKAQHDERFRRCEEATAAAEEHARNLERQLDLVRASTSWRLTRPIRVVGRLIKAML